MGSELALRIEPTQPDQLVFDSGREGRTRAFDRYANLYAAGGDVERIDQSFFAAVSARLRPGLAIFDRTVFGVEHRRGRDRIVRDGYDHFTLQLVRRGALMLEADGDPQALAAGDAVLVDMTRPFRSLPAGRLFTVSLPRDDLVAASLEPAALHGRRLASDDGELETLLASPGAFAKDAVVQAVRARLGVRQTTTASRLRQERARRYIDANLADADLDPSRIASAVGMSRATLYRTFEPLGGVTEWVQTRRLRRVRLLLATTGLPVAEVGRRAGFVNASHLTFAFQARFGCSPSGYRRSRAPNQPETGGAAAAFALDDITLALSRDVGPGRE